MPSVATVALLAVRDLTVVRSGDAGPVAVLRGVSLDVAAGTLTDIVGPSGSGKTTLLLAIARLLPGATGELTLAGTAASGDRAGAVARRGSRTCRNEARCCPVPCLHNLTLPWRLKVRAGLAAPATSELRAGARPRPSDRRRARPRGRSGSRKGRPRASRSCAACSRRPTCSCSTSPTRRSTTSRRARSARSRASSSVRAGRCLRVRHLRADEDADRRFRLEGGALTELTQR